MSYEVFTTPYGATSDLHTAGFLDTLKAKIDAHPAWEFVETVTGGTGGRTDVFRLLASQSGEAKDVYIMITRANNSGLNVNFAAAEDYDPATKKVIRYIPYTDNVSSFNVAQANQGDDSYNEGAGAHVYNDNDVIASGDTSPRKIAGITQTLVGQQTAVLFSITNKRIFICLSSSSQKTPIYLGWIEKPAGSLWRGGLAQLRYGANDQSGVTRASYNRSSDYLNGVCHTPGVTPNGKDVNLNAYIIRECWVKSYTAGSAYAYTFGRMRDCYDLALPGANYDDRAMLNGIEHACFGINLWVSVVA